MIEDRLAAERDVHVDVLRVVCIVADERVAARLVGVLKRVLVDAQRRDGDVVVALPEAEIAKPLAGRGRERHLVAR